MYKHLNTLSISLLICIGVYGLIFLADRSKQKSHEKPINFIIEGIENVSIDLYQIMVIRTALERFKRDNGFYPISEGFNGLYSRYGKSGPDWIPGLTPKYLEKLPRDSRMTESDSEQYLYFSNGAGIKLIAHLPVDCELVKSLYPDLIDPSRDCWAYGYWNGEYNRHW